MNYHIHIKLLLAMAGFLLLFLLLSFLVNNRVKRQHAVSSMKEVAIMVAAMSRADLEAGNYNDVRRKLFFLRENVSIEAAAFYSNSGELIEDYPTYRRDLLRISESDLSASSYSFTEINGKTQLRIVAPVLRRDDRIATLVLVSKHPEMKEGNWLYFLKGLLVIVPVLLFFFFLLRYMEGQLVAPWQRVTRSVTELVDQSDFRQRLQENFYDHTQELAKAVDRIITIVQEREAKISSLEERFEERLLERTLKLRAVRDEAMAAVEARSEFLAHMSHEIRTPLNGVIGLLSLLQDVSLNDEHRQLLETATRSANSLMLIVNDVLDLSKIEAGMIDFEAIVFDLRDVIEETVTLFVDMANNKGVELLCDISTEIYPHVVGDPNRLRQIITNLVGNAVKFTTQGEVLFRARLISDDGILQRFRFSVEDTGIGISRKGRSTIFDKFTQAEGSTTRNYGGTGLGLNLCKQLVELQEGKIGVKSQVGKGSLFWFTLPFEPVPGELSVPRCDSLKGKNILIVDDNRTSRIILESYLKVCKATVFLSDRADRVMVLLRDLGGKGISIDTLLIDYTLPKKNGLQLAAEVKIIFGEKSPDIHILSAERGVCDNVAKGTVKSVISKPVRLGFLYDTLTGRLPAPESDRMDEKPLQKDEQGGQKLNGKVLLVDDEPVNQKVGVMLLRKLGLEVDVAKGGREAVSMSTATEYDIILMDISMPEMNGFEATDKIRSIEAEKGWPKKTIIALTANAMKNVQERCLNEGMDDFISKPVKPELLAERLKYWLPLDFAPISYEEGNGSRLLTSLRSRNELERKIWDAEEALQFVSNDEELLCELITLFLQRKNVLMGEITRAISRGDSDGLCEAAHAFKGAVNHFSAEGIRDLAQTLEDMGRNGDMDGVEGVASELTEGVASLEVSLKKVLTL